MAVFLGGNNQTIPLISLIEGFHLNSVIARMNYLRKIQPSARRGYTYRVVASRREYLRTLMLIYFKVEFFTGLEGVGPFCHVLARTSADAEVIAKAQRLLSGSTDARVEHVWKVTEPAILAKVQPLAATGLPRILDMDAILAS